MRKYEHLIKKGIVEPMENVPNHGKAPFERIALNKNPHIAVHIIKDLPKEIPKYTGLHSHEHDEINLILSETGELKYKIILEDEEYIVTSPATVNIPKGIAHSAEVIGGEGIFVCIILD